MRHVRAIVLAAAAAAATGAIGSGQASAQQVFVGQNFAASQYDPSNPRLVPDTNGAAGADYFVELLRPSYSVYRKSDGARVQTSTISNFWAAAGVTVSDRAFDPRVLYDPHAKRWYAVAVDNFNNGSPLLNSFLFAISNSSDPTAGWKGFKIDSDSNDDRWADFPMVGYNNDVVTLSAPMYLSGSTSPPSLSTFVVIPKSDLLSPTPTVANASRFEELNNSATGFCVQPAVDMDNGPLPLPLLSITANGTGLKRNSVMGTPSAPSINTAGGFMPLDPLNFLPPKADQPGPKADIDTFDVRASSSVVRNNGELWAVNCVNVNGRAGLRWYHITENTNDMESGFISDPSLAFFYPSIAVNDFGDVVIGMSGTDPNTFVSAFAVVGKTVDGVTTFGTPFVTKPGVSDYQRLDGTGNNSWGHYSATTNDPTDPSIFWTNQEYVHATDVWGTQVTELILPQPGEARWKDPANGDFGTSANWFGGAAPTVNSHVIFSRATAPGGAGYTVTLSSDQEMDRLSVRQGNVTLALNGHAIVATNPGTALAVGEFAGTPTLTIDNGRLDLSGSILVGAGGRLILSGGGSSVIRASALSASGTIDLNDNDLIATASSYGVVAALVAQGRNGGAWDTSGLSSAAARNHPQHATTLGVMTGAEYLSVNGTSFNGFTVAPSDTLVKYTWYGDTDFNGRVNFDDYVRTDSGFNNHLSGWMNGDFDLNGAVNFDDYVLIDLAFNTQSGTLGRALSFLDGSDCSTNGMSDPALRRVQQHFAQFGNDYASHLLAAVPEPSATFVAAGAMLALLPQCRRRR
jgi:hypothetical protein